MALHAEGTKVWNSENCKILLESITVEFNQLITHRDTRAEQGHLKCIHFRKVGGNRPNKCRELHHFDPNA